MGSKILIFSMDFIWAMDPDFQLNVNFNM